MPKTLLRVNNLATRLPQTNGCLTVVENVSFTIDYGSTLALLGESGCGKSMTARSIIRLLPQGASINSESVIELAGVDVLALPEAKMQQVRGREIAMIFQEPMLALNPVMTIAAQLKESLRFEKLSKIRLQEEIIKLLSLVHLPEPEQIQYKYPFELSGGMQQRVLIALAISARPKLLIADEPTTALDVMTQAKIMQLLRELTQKLDMAMLLITHDLLLAKGLADMAAVMYSGQIMELGPMQDILQAPRHPYTWKLLQAQPSIHSQVEELSTIPGVAAYSAGKLCRFRERCDLAVAKCRTTMPPSIEVQPKHYAKCHLAADLELKATSQNVAKQESNSKQEQILSANALSLTFVKKVGLVQRKTILTHALLDINFSLARGETLGIVGESGCGKSTLAKVLLRLLSPDSGKITLATTQTLNARDFYKRVQIVFQDPYSSLDPKWTVQRILQEGLQLRGTLTQEQKYDKLSQVGLSEDVLLRYPHEFSGGQRQRIAIARALMVEPEILILDEPTSALDVSIQAQVLNVLRKLQKELNLSYIFISHNIAVVAHMAHNILVMQQGAIVESGSTDEIINKPKHPFTVQMLQAVT